MKIALCQDRTNPAKGGWFPRPETDLFLSSQNQTRKEISFFEHKSKEPTESERVVFFPIAAVSHPRIKIKSFSKRMLKEKRRFLLSWRRTVFVWPEPTTFRKLGGLFISLCLAKGELEDILVWFAFLIRWPECLPKPFASLSSLIWTWAWDCHTTRRQDQGKGKGKLSQSMAKTHFVVVSRQAVMQWDQCLLGQPLPSKIENGGIWYPGG